MQNKYISQIDGKIAAKSLLDHPFYKAWSAGRLSRETLADYARQYYHHVAAFPTYLSAVHSITEDQAARRMILANLMDEEAGSPNHTELWLQFASGLGVTEAEAKEAELYPETRQLIDRFRAVCRRGTTEGMTGLYCYESQIPSVSESKIAGLKAFYGMDNPSDVAYFKVHIDADKEHSAVERELLGSYINLETSRGAETAADEVLDALYIMLDGICVRNGVMC